MQEYVENGIGYRVKPEDLDEFFKKHPNAVPYSSEPGKITDSATADPMVESNIMGSNLESGSLEQPKTDDEIGFFEGIGKSFQNKPAEAKGYWYKFQLGMAPYIEFMGGSDAARVWLGDFSKQSMGKTGFVDPDTNDVVTFNNEAYDRDGHDAEENERYYELVKLRQSVPRYEENPVKIIDVASGKSIESKVAEEARKKFKQSLENQKKIKKITDSEGFLAAVKSGEVGDAIVQGSDFISQTAMQLVLARVTGGTSMMGIMYGDAYTTFNDEKSKLLYGEDDPDRFKKLIENDEDQIAIPAALGGLGYLMERAGYRGMMKQMAKRSFTGKTAVGLLATGNKEGLTEYGQGLTERLNLNLGKGMSLEDGVKDVSKYMWTEQAWENYFAGLIGGVGISGGGKAVNAALRYDETSNQFVNEKIKTINGLLELKAKTTNEKKTKNYEDLIQIQEVELKEYLENNNKISQYLSGRQKNGLIDLLNQKRETRKELKDVVSLYGKGILSKTELEASKSEIDNRVKRYDDGILKIKNDANMSLLMQDLDASGGLIKNIKNLEQLVYKTPAEFLAAVKAEYLAQGKTEKQFKQATKDVSIDGIKIGNKLLINAKIAAEKNAFGTGTHELLHGILKSTLQADDGTGNLSLKGESIVKDFISMLGSKQKKLIEERLKSGGYKFNKNKTEKEFKEYGEEYLNFYAQLSKEGKFSLNAIQKAGKWLSSFYRTNSEFKKLGFENGEQTKAFLDAFVADSKNGIYRKEFSELAEKGIGMKGTVEQSRSTVNLDTGDGDISQKIDALTEGAKTKAEFQKPRGAFDNIYSGMIEGKFDRIFGEGVSPQQKEIQRQNLADRLINYDPAKTPELSKWIYGGSGKAGNVVYAGLVAKKRLFEEGEKAKKTTTIDTKEAKELEDTSTPITEIEDKSKARNLKDFDIEVEDGLVDAEIIAEVESLLEKNPDNLSEQMERLILNDIRKKLDGIVGKIAMNKKTGKREPTPEYNSFIRNEYIEVIQSLGMETIRTAYRPWFEKKKVRTEKYKGISPTTGKPTNYVKDVFENTTNKREYIRWFLEGKPGSLTERRTALLRRIARRKAKIATDNYIEANSKDLEKVTEAKLRKLSRVIEDTKDEQKSFDSVRFSKTMDVTSLNQEFGFIKRMTKKVKTKWVGYINPYTNLPQTFVDLGRMYEQAFANHFMKMKIKGLEVISKIASEEGGMADFVMSFNNKIENHEIKASITAFMGSISISSFNIKNGVIKLATDVHNNLLGDIDMVEFTKGYKKRIDFVNKGIEKLNKKRPKDKQYDLLNPNVISGKPQYIPYELYMDKKGFGTKMFYQLKSDERVIQNHYAGKNVHSLSFVGARFANMSVRLSGKSILNLPMLSANTDINFTFRNSGSKMINGNKMIALSLGVQFKISKLKNDPRITPDITIKEHAEKALGINFSKSIDGKKLNSAINFSRSGNNESKGITVLDFDDTLATTKSLVKFTRPDGTTGTLNAEEYASTYEDLLDQGFTFDFSDFNKVVKGKLAPLFQKALKLQKKFGPENMFILTARPMDAQKAIFDFLKANGLNIPMKNITGLGNSTAEAKALWIADKVGDGFNDFYFADDALQNTQAVKNMLDQFDVKSKVQQAKVKFSKSMNDQFNDILEDVTGIESEKRFSAIKGRKRGESKGKFRFFIPPSHEDFVGLLYNFLGKGKEGNAHRDFFEQALIRPLNRANREYDTARQSVANDYKALNKQFEDVRKKLTKKTPDGDFTFQDAIRVYLWNKHGYKIPGLSETDQTNLSELVMSDPQLQAYAETLNVISKQETYVNPTEGWNSGDIRMDLDDATGRIGRKQFFGEFIENTDIIFSEENLNKIEAGYGKGVRESLEDMLYRIKTGRNRPTGQNEQVNKLMNYLNGSVGTVMFFNMRSALLQQMSIVNYINFADNNIFAAAKAFANQKQYWKDFAFIFNSDMLKQRRGGIQTDVNGAELAASLRNSKDITRKLISKLLELGFLPTQIGDNIAIATGGASYYRNRINKYIKQGLSKKEAEAKAFTDFQAITQSTQQSARPDMVSKQQASVIGKVILNFQNVTSQFNRLGKKAFQDIYNRRITKPNTTQMQSDISNAARITYYFAIQNAIFYTLQTALFAMMFDDDEEDDNKLFLKKKERLINGSIDSVLRGSGLIGGVVATLKNVAIAFARQRDVKYNPDESAVALEALNLSPVLGIKIRKIVNAEKTLNYNKKVIDEMSDFDIDNPQWSAVTNYTEAITNVPLNRLYNKTQNVRQALNNDHSAWERSLMFLGWSQYNLNLENKKMEDIKESVKSKKKSKKKKKSNLIYFN